MPRNRIDVEKIREILRPKFELDFSIREIAKTLKVSKTSVGEYIAEFNRTGLSYKDITGMSDSAAIDIFESSNKSANPLYEYISKNFRLSSRQKPVLLSFSRNF